eukprot:scaffold5773_cov322-Prasinococcus_capsulatus_cf.AAC.3
MPAVRPFQLACDLNAWACAAVGQGGICTTSILICARMSPHCPSAPPPSLPSSYDRSTAFPCGRLRLDELQRVSMYGCWGLPTSPIACLSSVGCGCHNIRAPPGDRPRLVGHEFKSTCSSQVATTSVANLPNIYMTSA